MTQREYATGVCTSCGETRYVAARGLCRACYARWRKNGTTDYVREFKDRTCSVEGCNNRQHGQGLCSKHLLRLRRTGTTDPGRTYTHLQKDPNEFITQHDLYPIWREFGRARNRRRVTPEWADSFEVFAAAVVSRPSKRHRIYPANRAEPLGPSNFEWREAILDKDPTETDPEYRARVRKANIEIYGKAYTESELIRKYGINYDQLQAMYDAQQGCCAICGEFGVPLDIDHHHETNAVRALLCQPCNKGLGHFKEDIVRLEKAIAYVKKYNFKGTGE